MIFIKFDYLVAEVQFLSKSLYFYGIKVFSSFIFPKNVRFESMLFSENEHLVTENSMERYIESLLFRNIFLSFFYQIMEKVEIYIPSWFHVIHNFSQSFYFVKKYLLHRVFHKFCSACLHGFSLIYSLVQVRQHKFI